MKFKVDAKRHCHWCEQRIVWDGWSWRLLKGSDDESCARAPFRAHEPRVT